MMFDLDTQRNEILTQSGNILIIGGPGSGKTTIALLKAKFVLDSNLLKPSQTILFLSFARATISRIEEHANIVIDAGLKSRLEITTYHSFAWTLLKSHGYLLNNKLLRLMPPHDASSKLSLVTDKDTEKWRLFHDEGLVHFDLFSELCATLFSKSKRLLSVFSDAYPLIIVDEFQDTNESEWGFIRQLGESSCIIALADAEQRIYTFKGASPARINDFMKQSNPMLYDFGTENNRSTGTDIVQFGNDLLTGKNIGKKYNDVQCLTYSPKRDNLHLIDVKQRVLSSYKRLSKKKPNDWSIAILVPSNPLMITVSDYLSVAQLFKKGGSMPSVTHTVAIDSAAPYISALFLANVLALGSQNICTKESVVIDLCEHILGRRGDKSPSQADIKLSSNLRKFIETGNITGKNQIHLVNECSLIAEKSNVLKYTGDIDTDWRNLWDMIKQCTSTCLINVAHDLKYLRLLRKGSNLYAGLNELWKQDYNYNNATTIVQTALAQEHFSNTSTTWSGINVMTIHKSKGKEFDDVIIFEGFNPGQRIVYDSKDLEQARIMLRVAVTRAKEKVTIFTPQNDKCVLL